MLARQQVLLFPASPLPWFVRSLVGLDRSAAQSAFSLILIGSTLSHAETIGLFSAMPEELDDLKAQITNRQEVEHGIIKDNTGSLGLHNR